MNRYLRKEIRDEKTKGNVFLRQTRSLFENDSYTRLNTNQQEKKSFSKFV